MSRQFSRHTYKAIGECESLEVGASRERQKLVASGDEVDGPRRAARVALAFGGVRIGEPSH